MFNAVHEILSDRVHKYAITREAEPISYSAALDLWQGDATFRSFFMALLSDSPFAAFRWETPPVTHETVNRPFEFVLLDSPGLAGRKPDLASFAAHFTDDANEGVVVFENLGRDAKMVVPSPRTTAETYEHLAAFTRGAPDVQQHALWRTVGEAVQRRLSDRPLWLSTAGGGVALFRVGDDKSSAWGASAIANYHSPSTSITRSSVGRNERSAVPAERLCQTNRLNEMSPELPFGCSGLRDSRD